LSLAFATNALAQEQCGESTCDKGYTCEVGDAVCPLILCVEGEDCPPCEPTPVEYCAPIECESDSECADYMECATFENTTCPETTPECAENDSEEECSDKWRAWEEQCEVGEMSQCTPKWHGTCEVAADCGEGFECVPYQECDCPPVDASSGELDRAAADAECVCTDLDERYCQANEEECSDDADCLENWTCGENYNSVCTGDDEGNFECEPADPAKICYAPEPSGSGGVIAFATGGDPAVSDLSAQSGIAPPQTAAVEEASSDDVAPAERADARESDSVIGDGDGDGLEEPSMSAESSSGGCSINGPTNTTGGASMLLLGLGAALGLRRRRAS
jgi:MYXO-CTERM domain-containing protein